MIKSLKTIMLLCLSLWIPTSVVRAHINSFATDQLKEMSQVMQLSAQLESLAPNDTLCLKYQGKDVIVRTKNNRVNHIGYCIFTPEQRSSMQSPAFDFLERYVLTLDLPLKRVKPINNQLAEDGISFSSGEISSMPHLYNDSTLNLSINLIEDKKYNVAWEKENIPYFSIEFPASYDLLHGTEMSENERRLAEDLASLAGTTIVQNSILTDSKATDGFNKSTEQANDYDLSDFVRVIPIEQTNQLDALHKKIISELKAKTPPAHFKETVAVNDDLALNIQTSEPEQDSVINIDSISKRSNVTRDQLISSGNINYYILPGDSYYFTDLNSNKYYRLNNNNEDFSLIFSSNTPIESISNLFTTGEIENEYNVDVTLKQYGFKEAKLTIKVNDFVNYFLEKGCKPYFGLMEYNDKKIIGLLIMLNRAEGYCHNIRITADVNILNDETKSFKARVVSYIPVSRIKSLYEEYEN